MPSQIDAPLQRAEHLPVVHALRIDVPTGRRHSRRTDPRACRSRPPADRAAEAPRVDAEPAQVFHRVAQMRPAPSRARRAGRSRRPSGCRCGSRHAPGSPRRVGRDSARLQPLERQLEHRAHGADGCGAGPTVIVQLGARRRLAAKAADRAVGMAWMRASASPHCARQRTSRPAKRASRTMRPPSVSPSRRSITKPRPRPSSGRSTWRMPGTGTPAVIAAAIRCASTSRPAVILARSPAPLAARRRISGTLPVPPRMSNAQVCWLAPPESRRTASTRPLPVAITPASRCRPAVTCASSPCTASPPAEQAEIEAAAACLPPDRPGFHRSPERT